MNDLQQQLLRVLADGVLVLHAAVVLFVVGGLVAILVGNHCGWRLVNAPSFRVVHLLAIVYVAVQSWFGVDCPLTTLEFALRAHAGAPIGDETAFIARALQWLLYWEAPPWVFVVADTSCMAAVAWAWWRFPPHWRRQDRDAAHVGESPERAFAARKRG